MKRIAIAERADWVQQAETLGFHFHTIDGERYWDERAYYAFTLEQIERHIEEPTRELHEMAMSLVEEAVSSEQILERLAIAPCYWDWVRESWRQRQPHLYGRMDLAYDGYGSAKLYELNYDTPTSLYEAAYFQWLWLEQQLAAGRLPANADQYNRIQELLCESFAVLASRKIIAECVHFSAVRDSEEDRATATYLRDCAHQVGITTEYVAIEDIGISAEGWFTDEHDRVIQTLFKLYPLEFMMEERFGPELITHRMQLLEPAWKAILSNKGILPLLWERFEGHPNLLPAYFEGDERRLAPGWVRKPLLSREGANIEMVTADGERYSSPGPYGDCGAIVQACHPLRAFEGRYPLIGSWVVADEPAGIGIREDDGPITCNTSRFVPHAIIG
jgi:glutathionylspermidine synthase